MASSRERRIRLIPLLADAYTVSGAVVGFGSIVAIANGNPPLAFGLYAIAMFIDYSDGSFARALGRITASRIVNGATLDHIVDFVTSAIAPAFMLWHFQLVPEPRLLWVSVVILATAFKFSRTFKPWLSDGFFTGIPTPWIHLCFYSFYLSLSAASVAAAIAMLALLTVLPFGFTHLARLPQLRRLNVSLLALWWISYLLVVTETIALRPWVAISVLQPVVYFSTSLFLFRRYRGSRSRVPSAIAGR